jgi:hypothetical protein
MTQHRTAITQINKQIMNDLATLYRQFARQATLSGVLNLLRVLDFTLLSVETLDEPASVQGQVRTRRDDFGVK